MHIKKAVNEIITVPKQSGQFNLKYLEADQSMIIRVSGVYPLNCSGIDTIIIGEARIPIVDLDPEIPYVLGPGQFISVLVSVPRSDREVHIHGYLYTEIPQEEEQPDQTVPDRPTDAPGGDGTNPPIDGGGGDDADTDTDGADPGGSDGDDDLDDDGADEGDGGTGDGDTPTEAPTSPPTGDGDYVDMGDGVNKLYPKSMQVFNATQPVVIRSQLPIGMDTAVFYASVSCRAPEFTVNNQPGVHMAIDTLTVFATELFHVPSLIGGTSISVATLVYMLGPEFINNRPEFEITITGKDPATIHQISGALVFSKSGFTPVGE